MNGHQIFSALLIVLLLAGCAATNSQNKQISPSNSKGFIAVQNGWQLSVPLNNMYEYYLVDVKGKQPKLIDLTNSDGGLLDYDIVFIGENHRHPGNHLAQAMIYQRMLDDGKKVMLSMEQFERDTQSTLDDYLAGEIGEWSLRHFGRAWENYQTSYRPLVELAKQKNMPVIAANAPKDAVTCVGRQGLEVLDKLPEARKKQVAASFHTPEEGAYFEKFAGAMSHASSKNKTNLNTYHAQVVRDDTMAESIHDAMNANPGYKLVHLNGHFHSASGLGTVERVKLRRDSKIAVIQPILVDDPTKPTFTSSDILTGDYLLLIYPLAEQVKSPENRKVWMKTVFKRSKQDCNFGVAEM